MNLERIKSLGHASERILHLRSQSSTTNTFINELSCLLKLVISEDLPILIHLHRIEEKVDHLMRTVEQVVKDLIADDLAKAATIVTLNQTIADLQKTSANALTDETVAAARALTPEPVEVAEVVAPVINPA